MLHHKVWQRRFVGDPCIVGRTLTLNGYRYTVIGVLPQEFHFFPIEISIAEIYGTLAYESSLHTGLVAEAAPELYAPTLRSASGTYDLVARSAVPTQLMSAVRRQFRELDRNLFFFSNPPNGRRMYTMRQVLHK